MGTLKQNWKETWRYRGGRRLIPWQNWLEEKEKKEKKKKKEEEEKEKEQKTNAESVTRASSHWDECSGRGTMNRGSIDVRGLVLVPRLIAPIMKLVYLGSLVAHDNRITSDLPLARRLSTDGRKLRRKNRFPLNAGKDLL